MATNNEESTLNGLKSALRFIKNENSFNLRSFLSSANENVLEVVMNTNGTLKIMDAYGDTLNFRQVLSLVKDADDSTTVIMFENNVLNPQYQKDTEVVFVGLDGMCENPKVLRIVFNTQDLFGETFEFMDESDFNNYYDGNENDYAFLRKSDVNYISDNISFKEYIVLPKDAQEIMVDTSFLDRYLNNMVATETEIENFLNNE